MQGDAHHCEQFLNAEVNAFLSSQNYKFAIAIQGILLKFWAQKFQ